MNNKPKHILVRFTGEEHSKLKTIAAIRGESLTTLIRKAIFLDVDSSLLKKP